MMLILPLPNSANTHWRHGRGITYLSKQGREFRERVVGLVKTVHPNHKPFSKRLDVTIDIHPKDRRKIDLDNRIKPLLDALQHANVFLDDSQIDRLEVNRREITTKGDCKVYIKELE